MPLPSGLYADIRLSSVIFYEMLIDSCPLPLSLQEKQGEFVALSSKYDGFSAAVASLTAREDDLTATVSALRAQLTANALRSKEVNEQHESEVLQYDADAQGLRHELDAFRQQV